LAIKLILLGRFAGTKPISHVFAFACDIIFPFVHADAGVTLRERWYYTAVLDAPLTIA
jgi:hypothetical protein